MSWEFIFLSYKTTKLSLQDVWKMCGITSSQNLWWDCLVAIPGNPGCPGGPRGPGTPLVPPKQLTQVSPLSPEKAAHWNHCCLCTCASTTDSVTNFSFLAHFISHWVATVRYQQESFPLPFCPVSPGYPRSPCTPGRPGSPATQFCPPEE